MIMKDMDLSLIGETAAILTCMHAHLMLGAKESYAHYKNVLHACKKLSKRKLDTRKRRGSQRQRLGKHIGVIVF